MKEFFKLFFTNSDFFIKHYSKAIAMILVLGLLIFMISILLLAMVGVIE